MNSNPRSTLSCAVVLAVGLLSAAARGQGPVVLITSPVNGETAVALESNVVITFVGAINPATFSGSVNGAPMVPTQIVVDDFDTVVTLDLGETEYAKTYAIVVDGTVQSPGGDPMGADFSFSFTTETNPDPKRPTTTIVVPPGPITAGETVVLTGQGAGYVWEKDADNPLELWHWNQAGTITGDRPMLHPTAWHFPDGYDGYEYWLIYTPYPPGASENPVVVRSNDGVNFDYTGVSNPVFTYNMQPPFDMQNLADPEVYLLGETWMLFYEMETPASTAAAIGPWMKGGGYMGVALSDDGVNWEPYGGPYTYDPGNPPTGFPPNGNPVIWPEDSVWYEAGASAKTGEPAVFFKDGTYHMYRTVTAHHVAYDTAPDPRGPWTKEGLALESLGGGYGPHPDAVYDPQRDIHYLLILIPGSHQLDLYAADDPAGPWTKHPISPMFSAEGGWEGGDLYRSSFVQVANHQWYMYYSGNPATSNGLLGLAREVAGVRTVEVSTNNDATWTPATVAPDGSWSFSWIPFFANNAIQARVVDDFMRGDPVLIEVNDVVGGAGGGPPGDQPAEIDCGDQVALDPPEMPLLVVTDSGYAGNVFGCYLTEILRGEGLVEFQRAERALLMAEADPLAYLAAFDVVILAEMALTTAEEQYLRDYVTGGGNLIAMRPDHDLLDLFGVTFDSVRAEQLFQYFAFDTVSGPGVGIVSESLQYHGEADNYTLAGAVALADLYNDINTPSVNPAVTLATAGSGQAVAYAFDLAHSIVMMRQGNPAWQQSEGDGRSGIRPMDLFRRTNGDSWFDPQRMAIPQADEQQRFLANAVLELAGWPVPRMWYLPNGHKAIVVNTGDGEGLSGSSLNGVVQDAGSYGGFFSTYFMTGGINGTSVAMEAGWRADGHESGVHSSGTDTDYDNLRNNYQAIVNALFNKFGHLSRTARNHTLDWVGWSEMAEICAEFGTGMECNYYHSVAFLGSPLDYAGYFTGSGLPQRFSDENGTLLGIYQALTTWPDETFADAGLSATQTHNLLVGMLNSAETDGYYSAFVNNIHAVRYNGVDPITNTWANSIWAYCQANGIPMWSAEMLMDFTEARNLVRFENLYWNGTTLGFDYSTPLAGHGLNVMIPSAPAAGTLLSVHVDGAPVVFTQEVIKGREYAFVEITSTMADVVATYGIDETPPVITNVQVIGIGDTAATVTWDTDEPATSVVDYGTSSGSYPLTETVPGLALSHSVLLTGLSPTTTYYFQVTSADGSGNSDTSAEHSFTTDLPCWLETTTADFSAGQHTDTEVIGSGDGAVRLATTTSFFDDFPGTSLDLGTWDPHHFGGGTPNVTVDSSFVTVTDRTAIRSIDTFDHITVEGLVTLTDGQNAHFGLATALDSTSEGVPPEDTHWIIFSAKDGDIVARTRSDDGMGGTNGETDTVIAGLSPGVEYLFRIEWNPGDTVEFYVDEIPVAVHNRYFDDDVMRIYLSAYTGQTAIADFIQVTGAYALSGTYTSSTFDTGGTADFDSLSWAGGEPGGTTIGFETRTSLDGVSFSPWEPLSGGVIVSPDGQYVAYRALLATSDDSVSPQVDQVCVTYQPGPDTTPPAVTATDPSDAAVDVAVGSNISITYNEPVVPGTFSPSISGGVTFLTTFTDGGRTAVLDPDTDLDHLTAYTVSVAAGVEDLEGNPTASPLSFAFTTVVAPGPSCLLHTTTADFSPGDLQNIVVTSIGDGEIALGTGELLVEVLNDPFAEPDGPASNWTELTGSWNIVAQEYTNAIGGGSYGASIITGASYGDFVIAARMKGGTGGFFWSIQDPTPGPDGYLQAWKNGAYMLQWDLAQARVFRWTNSTSVNQIGNAAAIPIGTEYGDVRVEARGSEFKVYINDALVITANDATYGAGAIGLMGHDGHNTHYDDVVLSEIITDAGIYTSVVVDATESVNWGAVTWTSTVPVGTSLDVFVRTGDTAVPDGTWSAFNLIPASGDSAGLSGQYVQYRVDMARTDPGETPVLEDIAIVCESGEDVTPPVITNVAAVPDLTGTNATVTWDTNEPADSLVEYGLTAGSLTLSESDGTLVMAHSVDLTGLIPGTTYYYRVTSADAAANSATEPEPPDSPLTFTTPLPVCFADTTAADFSAGSGTDVEITTLDDGEVNLASAALLFDHFDGTELDPGTWETDTFSGDPPDVLVAGSAVTVNNRTYMRSIQTFDHVTIEGLVTLASGVNAHFGLATALDSVGEGVPVNDIHWLIFTSKSGQIQARTRASDGGGPAPVQQDDVIAGLSPGTQYLFRIVWSADDTVEFFVDGVSVATHSRDFGADVMRIYLSSNVGQTGSADWVSLSGGFAPVGLFESRIGDAGEPVDWGGVTWTSIEPAGTSLAISARTGYTATPDGSWTAFAPIAAPGSPVGQTGRYVQYRADLASFDPGASPTLEDLEIVCGPVANLPPTANDDDATVVQGDTVDIDVLDNDDDTDGSLDPASVTITTPPSYGTVTNIDALTGVVTYEHDGSATSTDSFQYTVDDDFGSPSNQATVSIDVVNEIAVSIALAGMNEPVTRCIQLELFECSGGTTLLTQEVAFSAGSPANLTLEVPIGDYDCMRARDPLHTLWRLDNTFTSPDDAHYTADFTNQTGGGGPDQSLAGGNANGDPYVDILDFGHFIGMLNQPLSPSTTCADTGPHPDFDGDGTVFVSDYTFIMGNFLEGDDGDCCPGPMPMFGPRRPNPQSFDGPITRVSVQELRRRGLHQLIAGDLNQDGWLDVADMVAFMGGAQPVHGPSGLAGMTRFRNDGGSWFDAANWSYRAVPEAGTDIAVAVTVVVDDYGASANDVLVRDGGTLRITSGGLLAAGLEVEAGGALHLDHASSMLTVTSLTLHEGALLLWHGGVIEVEGGVYTQADLDLLVGQGAYESTLRLVDGAEARITRDTMIGVSADGVGVIEVLGGTLTTGRALMIGHGGEGWLVLDDGAVSASGVHVGPQGTILGTGMIAADVNSSGEVWPGVADGGLLIEGSYGQMPNAALVIEVGAGPPARLEVTGVAVLSGTLVVVLTDGQDQLRAGDELDIVTAGAVVGRFDRLETTELRDGLRWTVYYRDREVVLTVSTVSRE